jgi:large subunit ribosomal protein L6
VQIIKNTMSRIGKKKIDIPAGTEVSISGTTFSVKGKEGELVRTFNDIIEIKKEDNQISVNPKDESKFARAM